MNDSLLETLCRICGIEPRYHDIWGNEHHVTPEIVRALADAMGVDSTNKSMDAVVHELEAAEWRRLLPPVQVMQASDADRHVLLRLPEDDAGCPRPYAIVLENGARHDAEVRPSNLSVRERFVLDGRPYAAYALALPELPLGYHRLELGGASMLLVVAPADCYLPEAVANGGRVWGAALQLYALRSPRNWGIGDFTDLRVALEHLAQQGAAVVGLNPLHALYPHNPLHISPYSPSSRLFLNVIYLDVEGIAEFAQCAPAQQLVYSREFQRRLDALRAQEYVDYAGVAAAKFPVLEMLYQYFRERHLARDTERARLFREFQQRDGELLYRHTLYEALQEYFHRKDPAIWGWPVWPAEYRDPSTPAVAQWAAQHGTRIEYYQYLQWQADRQLGAAGRRSYLLGMGIGLYQDLAVSVDRGGAETWSLQGTYARDVSVGAPPDEFALNGQDWGLPPLVPRQLREAAYAPFIATLRANMRHGGALRIDHVMGLMRLYWVAPGTSARDGAYVNYPFRDLLGILALESHRNRCLVIGEDLGTVPDEVRARLAPMNVLSYRLFYFERQENGDFNPPSAYPERALAAVSTHDLPTLAGYWKGQDITERERLGLYPSNDKREQQILQRTQDRVRLLIALQREGLLPEGATVDPASIPEMMPELARAVHVYLARSSAKVVVLQPEDLIGERRQANLPGTVDQHPNWRRKLVLDIADLAQDPRARSLFAALNDIRGPGAKPRPDPRPSEGAAIPSATYRFQFHRDFTFRDAAALAPYLQALGVSHCYASPYLKARPGSRHGYDIVDHNSLNPEIGAAADYDAFVDAMHRYGLRQVLDIVPNHMGIGSDNQWWLDVLENGPGSVHADFFDIDWYPLKSELHGKVLLPVLGDHYGSVLERGELALAFDRATGVFEVHYYQHRFPVDPGTYPLVLGRELRPLEEALGAEHKRFTEYQSLIAALGHLPDRNERSNDRIIERYRDKELHKKRLAHLCAEPALAQHIERLLALYNGGSGGAGRWDLLHELLERQAYRVAYWRVASDEINYRRFFDVNDLAALRMENVQTFYTTHRLISDLIAQGKVNGLRIDHPDGLYDPREYYQRLQNFVTTAVTTANRAHGRDRALYLIVEKILASHEHVPEDWPVHGTTGYDFINLVNGLFVYAPAEQELDKVYARFTGETRDFEQLLAECKRLIMRISLSSELNVLANYLNRLSEADRRSRDFTLNTLRYALRELVAFFPVYRTYIRGDRISEEDRRYVEWAVAQAKKHSAEADDSVYGYLRRMLLLEGAEHMPETYRRGMLDFAARFQQYSAPVMAKGMEDTAFYRYNRLVSLNEVGGDPRRFALSVAAFHHGNHERWSRFPHSMLATSTHDTKRSEDVRARINVISEVADEWREAVQRWSRMNRGKKRKLEDGSLAPDRNDEYLLYQTLVGAWPLEPLDVGALGALRQRIEAYMLKAVREAKAHTSWLNPNEAYEQGTQGFVQALLASLDGVFLKDFVPFAARLARFGLYNSLSQLLLKLTAPGVPDTYQGNELWDFSLVDPDNRRAVDYAKRQELLIALHNALTVPVPARVRALVAHLDDGRAKLYLTWKVLSFRRDHAALFRDGDYTALGTDGDSADHVCAFARRHAERTVVTVATRWFARRVPDGALPLDGVWKNTWIEAPQVGTYINVLTGEKNDTMMRAGKPALVLSALLAHFPVALLTQHS
jgi:(1->4)-alpha-D-glucan 1-alpha-D-glucosylmutase